MVMSMRANGRRIKLMALGGISIWTELNIQEIESMISRRVKGPRLGLMGPCIRGPT
jgi:hypothetical protein